MNSNTEIKNEQRQNNIELKTWVLTSISVARNEMKKEKKTNFNQKNDEISCVS